ncbi:MAG: integration host factor subunit beta [Alphaproteobacteria bacterium]|nr:integration host factor subunit beta [Alphaproteobacteria bacterium]
MIKSELVEKLAEQEKLSVHVARRIVDTLFNAMTNALVDGDRVELREFGVLSVRTRKARTGRNPKTGAPVAVQEKRVPFFKAGKAVKEALNKKGA